MRRALLLTAVLAACASNDAPESDSAAAVSETAATLAAADISGTWSGTTMPSNGDSILNRWTIMNVDERTSHMMLEGVPDTIVYTVRYDADSLIATSEPYTTPDMPNTPVTFRSVGRLDNGTLRGTVAIRLASNADSVLERNRWEATRAP
jgi:hypothetical protein